jgi:hypothetical protein
MLRNETYQSIKTDKQDRRKEGTKEGQKNTEDCHELRQTDLTELGLKLPMKTMWKAEIKNMSPISYDCGVPPLWVQFVVK